MTIPVKTLMTIPAKELMMILPANELKTIPAKELMTNDDDILQTEVSHVQLSTVCEK